MRRSIALALLCLSAGHWPAAAQSPSPQLTAAADTRADTRSDTGLDLLLARIAKPSTPSGTAPASAKAKRPDGQPVTALDLAAAVQGRRLTAEQSRLLWDFLADESHTAPLTPVMVRELVAASTEGRAADAMWSELAGLSRALAADTNRARREASLLGAVERARAEVRPILAPLLAAKPADDDIVELMQRSRVFGADLTESVTFVAARAPATVARHIERMRGLGRPVRWEYTAYESILRWKADRLVAGGANAPRTAAEFDAAGEAFIAVFNCLHGLDEGYREVMLRGLGATELFNAVVAGEKELYRLGTSGYRNFLHAAILRGIRQAGSFEAFLARSMPPRFGPAAARSVRHRGMVFLRIAGAFGLLDQVLETIGDRKGFIDGAIDGISDERAFEANAGLVLDVLLAKSPSRTVSDFKLDLLDHLYDHYYAETEPVLRNIMGSILSVYQTVVNGRRDPAIDAAFPLDDAAFRITFARAFSADDNGGVVHRMFMRLDQNEDDAGSYDTFRSQMRARGASIRDEQHFDVFRFEAPGRAVEIYANKPSAAGLRQGLERIGEALAGKRVETVIGRGHTSIIAPLQADARRVVGKRLDEVALVIVGACGGDASVRELVSTFGYIPLVTTASTGRQVINDAIITGYIAALLALAPGDTLSVADVLDRAIGRFRGGGETLASDAGFYQANLATVLSARLFDTHVRPLLAAGRTAARE